MIDILESHTLYDVLTKETIKFTKGEFVSECSALQLDYTSISHMVNKKYSRTHRFLLDRYVLEIDKNLIFVLQEFDSDKEYQCLTNKTIFLHLGIPYNENEAKYVYELRKQRQHIATIGNKLFYLKGQKPSNMYALTKGEFNSPKALEIRAQNKQRNALARRLRTRIIHALCKNNNIKQSSTLELIGCDIEYLKLYLSNQFTEGMSWENYGKWHIDHIIPCFTFDLYNIENQRKCFHYTNLRPLWANENLSRKKRI